LKFRGLIAADAGHLWWGVCSLKRSVNNKEAMYLRNSRGP